MRSPVVWDTLQKKILTKFQVKIVSHSTTIVNRDRVLFPLKSNACNYLE